MKTPKNWHKNWSLKEEQRLLKLRRKGYNWDAIGDLLHRTREAVRVRHSMASRAANANKQVHSSRAMNNRDLIILGLGILAVFLMWELYLTK